MEVIIVKAITMTAIIVLGYILKKVGFADKNYFPILSKVAMNITLPCLIITKFSDFTMQVSLLSLTVLGIVLNIVMNGIGYLMGRSQGRDQSAFYMINIAGFNIGAFTLPFVQNFLSAEGLVATCLFDAGNSLMCTGGTFALASMAAGKGERKGIGAFLKKLFSSVPMDTYLIMLLFAILGIRLPGLVTGFAETVGAANPFLAMIVIGLGFEWRMKREEAVAAGKCLLIRYAIAAVLAVGMYRLLPFSLEVRQAMTLIAFAPLSALCPVFTQRVGGNEELSSTVNSMTILISTVIMTVLLMVLHIS